MLGQGTHEFPFSLRIPKEPLPAPFKSIFGSLQYKITVYIRSSYCYVQVAEKMLKFRGWNILPMQSLHLKPPTHESGFSKSLFSSKKELKVSIALAKSGFLLGEDI